MTVISEHVDATVDRFIGILSFCRLWAAFSFRPQLGLAVGAYHPSLGNDLPAENACVAIIHRRSPLQIIERSNQPICDNFLIRFVNISNKRSTVREAIEAFNKNASEAVV